MNTSQIIMQQFLTITKPINLCLKPQNGRFIYKHHIFSVIIFSPNQYTLLKNYNT
jgi:hypothetical protein